MDRLFLTVLNMSIAGAFVIAAVCLARLFLKKAPKTISYCLWAVVLLNLVVPFKPESAFSLMPFRAYPVPEGILVTDADVTFAVALYESLRSPFDETTIRLNPEKIDIDSESNPYGKGVDVRYLFGFEAQFILLSYIWSFGTAALLVYGIASFIRLKRKMRGAVHVEGNIYDAVSIKSPFVLGICSPKIYLPAGLSEHERGYVLLHEQTHIRRRDHIVKFVAYFVLCLHWFNPLAWVAFLLMGADMEMSCDERVMKEIGGDIRDDYSMSLVRIATGRRILNGSPLAFGEGGMKERIKRVLNFKKPSKIIIIAAVFLVIVLSFGFAVNRISGASNESEWDANPDGGVITEIEDLREDSFPEITENETAPLDNQQGQTLDAAPLSPYTSVSFWAYWMNPIEDSAFTAELWNAVRYDDWTQRDGSGDTWESSEKLLFRSSDEYFYLKIIPSDEVQVMKYPPDIAGYDEIIAFYSAPAGTYSAITAMLTDYAAKNLMYEIDPQKLGDLIYGSEYLRFIMFRAAEYFVLSSSVGHFMDEWDLDSWEEYEPDWAERLMDERVIGIIVDNSRTSIHIFLDHLEATVFYEWGTAHYRISQDTADAVLRQFHEFQDSAFLN